MGHTGRAMPNRPHVAHTSPGDTLDASTPTVWSVGEPRGNWHVGIPQPRWRTDVPEGRWQAGQPRGE